MGWDDDGAGLWPARDTPGPALHHQSGPQWVDDAAAAAKARLLSARDAPLVLGHGDWEAHPTRLFAVEVDRRRQLAAL